MSQDFIKPLELVISAIHSLKEVKGATPQDILRYLVQKYNVHADMLKPYIQAGLVKGMNFGLITQESGSYRLNDVLSVPPHFAYRGNSNPNTNHKQTKRRRLTKLKISKRGRKKRHKIGIYSTLKRTLKKRKEKKRKYKVSAYKAQKHAKYRRKQNKLKMKMKARRKQKNEKMKTVNSKTEKTNSGQTEEQKDDAPKPILKA